MISKPTSYDCEISVKNEALNSFKPIIMAWFQVLEDYANLSNVGTELDRDSAFGYRERPQVGFLAAAAWRAGGVALEEWGTSKGDETVQSYGRNDLWIRLGVKEWFIEAKHHFCRLHKSEVPDEMVNHLKWAHSDIGKLKLENQLKVGALFVSPLWKSENLPDRTAALATWKAACYQVEADLTAIVLDTKSDNSEWAGLALFLVGATWGNQPVSPIAQQVSRV